MPAGPARPARSTDINLPPATSDFAPKLTALVQRMKALGHPIVVTSKQRTAEEQARLYRQGRGSKGRIVTEKSGQPGDESLHQQGLAADIAFVGKNGQPDYSESHPWQLLGDTAKTLGLFWGGDWPTLQDRPHVQLPPAPSTAWMMGEPAAGTPPPAPPAAPARTAAAPRPRRPPVQAAALTPAPAPPAAPPALHPSVTTSETFVRGRSPVLQAYGDFTPPTTQPAAPMLVAPPPAVPSATLAPAQERVPPPVPAAPAAVPAGEAPPAEAPTPADDTTTPAPGGYHPTEILKAWREEFPKRFDRYSDGELLDAIRAEDPATFKLVDPQLIGAELLPQPAAAQPQGPLPVYHPPASTAEQVISTGLRTVPMLAGGLGGAALGGVGAPVLGAAGAAVGDVAAQGFERMMGTREDYSPAETAVQVGLGLVPLGEVAGMGRLAATGIRAGQGALLGRAGGLTESLVTGEPPGPALPQYATGAAFGGVLHGAGEAYGAVHEAAPSFRPEDMGLPTGAALPDPAAQAARATQMQADAHQLEAQEISKDFAKRGWEVPPAQRGTLGYGQQAKAYLDTIADLIGPEADAPPPMMPPIGPVPPTPPPQKLLPPSPILAYGPEGPPPSDFVVPGTPQRGVQAQPTIDRLADQLESNLYSGSEGPPRLNPEKQIQLTAPPTRPPIATQPPLVPRGTPPGRPQRLIQKGATPAQPYLPGATQPQPLDRVYPEGPNAGPRREGEPHGVPRAYQRRVYTPGSSKYTYEQPGDVIAEDPATYPPEVRRELARMAEELREFPYQRGMQIDTPTGLGNRGAGYTHYIQATPWAPVAEDLSLRLPTRSPDRSSFLPAIRAALLEGKGSLISDVAATVARERLAEEAAGTTPRHRVYKPALPPGAGDALIGWVDEAGNKALAEQDRTPEQQIAHEATVQEIRDAITAWQRGMVTNEETIPFFHAMIDEGVRRGMIRPEQQSLTMEGPGGAGGPSLFDFEGEEPPKKPAPRKAEGWGDLATPNIEEELGIYERRRDQQAKEDAYREVMGIPPDQPLTDFQKIEAVVGPAERIPPGWAEGEEPPQAGSPVEPGGAAGSQPALPGTEGVRETEIPTPEVAEAPFALTPPPAKPEFGSKESAQRSLFDRLKDDVGAIAIPRKLAGDRAGFKQWLAQQEKEHGDEAWFNRAEEAVAAGDHDRAWKIASAAAVRAYAKAAAAATTPQDEAALRRAVKGTALQADIQTQIVGQARRRDMPKAEQAPYVEDFPPSARVSQAGAARGRATIGPAGIVNPGPPQKPLAGSATDYTLARTLQKTLIESTDPKLLHLIPGNVDTNLRLYRQIADLAFQGVNTRELKQYLKLSDEEIAQHFLRAPAEAARTLQQLSAFRQVHAKTLDRAAEAISMGGALEGMIRGGEGEPPLIVGARGRVIGRVGQIERERTLEALAEETRSFDQLMLTNTLQKPVKQSEMDLLQAASYPFMISQIATAERNALTQAGRYGMDTLDEALTIPLAKLAQDPLSATQARTSAEYRLAAVGRPGAYVTPRRSWKATVQDIYDISAETLSNMSPEDARATLKMLTEFPTEGAHFLGWASSAGEFEGARGPSSSTIVNWALNPKVQRWLTVFNRAQEFTGRALVYDATMRSQIAARGLRPSEVLQLPTPEIAEAVGGLSILDDMVHVAVASSLEATFAGRAARNSIPGALLRMVNQAGFLKLGYPFPKFNISAAPRYIWDHGPWALMDLVRFPLDAVGLSPSEFFVPGAKGRLYRGVRAQKYRRVNIPEAIGKRQLAERSLSTSVRELASTRRELTVRQNMVKRLERKAQAGLPDIQTTLDQASEIRDQLARRAERVRGEIDTHEGTIRDLRAQEESLLDDVYDAEGIRAPNLPQYFARIATGTFGPLAAAFVIRSMPGAQGTKWYQYQIDDPRSWVDGKPRDPVTLDFRPFAPYAQYLFVADVMRDFEQHTDWTKVKADMAENAGPLDWTQSMWSHYTGKYTGQELGGQFAEAFLSMSRAAGTTLTILDLMKANGWPSPTDAADAIIGTIGQFLSRFTVSLRTAKDVLGSMLPEEAKARIVPRATAEEPFRPLVAPLSNVPFLSRVIPERISQTTGEPVATEFPLLRALAGIGATPKDFVTQEVQRVGVPGQSVFIRETGDYPLDRIIAETYSRILEKRLPRELERPYYRRLGTPADQRDYLQRIAFPAFKREAVGRVKQLMGYERVEASTVRGEAARRKQRRIDLLDRLQGELGPAPPDDTEGGGPPPGPPPGIAPPAGFGPPPAGP